MLAEGPYVETHPRDQIEDPMAAELAKRVLMSIIEDNTNRYAKVRRRVVSGALGVGTWYAMAHWKRDRGPFGDLVFETLGPDQVVPCPGYLDIHDPCNPRVIIERHLTPDEIAAKGGDGDTDWRDTEGLWPDNRGRYGTEEDWAKAQGEPSPQDEYAPDTVTVLYGFYRGDYETESADGGFRDLSDDEQYMACPRCGFREDEHDRNPDGTLPEIGMPCPQCLNEATPEPSYLYRVTREKLTEQRLKYPKGRLIIVAPNQHRTFYDGAWPAPTRSFPIWQMRAYESPYEQMGGTDTLIYWSIQALMDEIRKQAYEQMVTNKPVIVFAGGPDGKGLLDSRGEPFLYTDENGQVAYAPDLPPGVSPATMVHQFQGNGMPGSLPALYSILSGSFYQTRGVGQVQFGPEQSKDVAYRSLLLQKESGDIPVEDHKQIMREEEGLFLGCVLDIWVHNSNEPRVIRYLGQDGAVGFQLLKGSDIPNVDVIVGTPPQIKQGAIDEVQAISQWSQIPSSAVRRIVARRLGLPPSEVAEVEAEIMQAQMQQAQPGGPAALQQGQPPPDLAAMFGGMPPG